VKLPGRDVPWKDFLRTLYKEFTCDNLLDYAGSVAFSAALALFPFLLFAVALAGLVINPDTLASLVEQIRRVMPAQAAELLVDRLHALTSGARPGLVTVGAIGAVWAASGAIAALITAFNTAWDVHESRPFWKVRGMAILVTVAAAVAFIASAAIALATPAVASQLGTLGVVLLLLRWPVAAVLMAAILACLYYFLPDVEQDFRFLTPGSIVAVVLWIVASMGLSLYVGHFGNYEVVYGALGGVIVLLLWLWISALAVLVGAEINAVIEHLSPEGKRTGAKSLADRGPDLPETEKRA
jgi:membrane protein